MGKEELQNQYKTAWELHKFLDKKNVRYAVIGGIALQYWGRPRLTLDIDITVMVPFEETDDFIKSVLKQYESRIKGAENFVKKNRVLLIKDESGCDIDMMFAVPGYEEEVMKRTTAYEISEGKKFNICSAEDLIIHKAVAGRPVDTQDINGIILRQQDSLDKEYIIKWLGFFADELADAQVITRFKGSWEKYMGSAGKK